MQRVQTNQNRQLNRLKSATLEATEARSVDVEASFTRGLPGFSIVGLASSDIQESKERVKSSLLLSGFSFPPLRITMSLSPSELRKNGSHFDLSLALLTTLNERKIPYDDIYVFGELGLDGRVKSSSMIFPIVLSLKQQGLIKRAIVPKEAMGYLCYIKGIEFYAVESLKEAHELLVEGLLNPTPCSASVDSKTITVGGVKYFYSQRYESDFIDVRGQERAKRAALIAAAGMHNLMLEGSPGSGKSMIAKRLGQIMPPLSQEEILSIAKQEFLSGAKPTFEAHRPFRSPHHTSTSAAIFGGGSGAGAKIGEVALANCGLLFFDEIPHFSKAVLEALREPLQDYKVHISRVNSKITYDAKMLFVAALNPCPCGNLLSKSKECRCTQSEINRYKNRLSDPILDRIDIVIQMQESSPYDKATVGSKDLQEQVLRAFEMQKNRGQKECNGKLSEGEIVRFVQLDNEAQAVLNSAIERFGLSQRGVDSVKRVARTIADIDGEEDVLKRHLLEALSYRRR